MLYVTAACTCGSTCAVHYHAAVPTHLNAARHISAKPQDTLPFKQLIVDTSGDSNRIAKERRTAVNPLERRNACTSRSPWIKHSVIQQLQCRSVYVLNLVQPAISRQRVGSSCDVTRQREHQLFNCRATSALAARRSTTSVLLVAVRVLCLRRVVCLWPCSVLLQPFSTRRIVINTRCTYTYSNACVCAGFVRLRA